MHYIMEVYFSENNSKESLIYFSMSTLLGQEKLNIFLVGSGAPRRRSMVNCMNSVLGMRVVCLC